MLVPPGNKFKLTVSPSSAVKVPKWENPPLRPSIPTQLYSTPSKLPGFTVTSIIVPDGNSATRVCNPTSVPWAAILIYVETEEPSVALQVIFVPLQSAHPIKVLSKVVGSTV